MLLECLRIPITRETRRTPPMIFTMINNRDRIGFVHQWAAYVHSHPDQVWSKQQNVIINAALQSYTSGK